MNNKKWDIYQQAQCRNGGEKGVMPTSMSNGVDMDVDYIVKTFNPKNILIVGIGHGDEMKLLAEKGRNVKALTICEDEKEYLKPKELQDKVDVGDIHDTNYKNGEFDFIFIRQTIEHLVSPYIALMEIRRITTMNGHIFITAPSMESCSSDWHLYVFNLEQWKELFRKLGFRIDKIKKTKCYIKEPPLFIEYYAGYTQKFTLTKTPINDESIHKWVEIEINKIGGRKI